MACSNGTTGTDDSTAGKAVLFVSVNTGSAAVGKTVNYYVDAKNAEGKTENVTCKSENEAVATADIDENKLTITGISTGTTNIVVTSASGKTASVEAVIYNTQYMEIKNGLLLSYTSKFSEKWNDAGSDGDEDASFWQPVSDTSNSWYPVGSLITNKHSDPSGSSSVVILKDISDAQNILAAPTDYKYIWNDSGSDADDDGSVWLPVAPDGYVAMGVVVNSGHSKPSTNIIRCVKKEYVVDGQVGNKIYYDKGTDSDDNLGTWELTGSDNVQVADGQMFILPGTSVAAPSYDSSDVDSSLLHVFLVDLPVVEERNNTSVKITLSDYNAYVAQFPRYSSTVRIPFTLITDSNHTTGWKTENSPFYLIQREDTYKSLSSLYNQTSADVTRSYTISKSITNSESNKTTTEYGMDITAEAGVTVGPEETKLSVTLSKKLGQEKESSISYTGTEEDTKSFTIPAGKFVDIENILSYYNCYNSWGESVGSQKMNSDNIWVLMYPLE
ncbi:MAG: Vps62-related protein [Treponema sp.]|nr:Vps62-related protein [Treponema sp.]